MFACADGGQAVEAWLLDPVVPVPTGGIHRRKMGEQDTVGATYVGGFCTKVPLVNALILSVRAAQRGLKGKAHRRGAWCAGEAHN